jgi:hypothetical protein
MRQHIKSDSVFKANLDPASGRVSNGRVLEAPVTGVLRKELTCIGGHTIQGVEKLRLRP